MEDTPSAGVLSAEQREQFITQGYIVLRGAFSREDSIAWVQEECAHVGIDLADSTTWDKPYVRIPTRRHEPLATFAPAAWQAACALMGGEERVNGHAAINLFAVNLTQGADRPFEEPSPSSPGWHKDGWHFNHFLDSYEQGLLGIPLMTDVLPHGGATFVAAGSVGPVARYLAQYPAGIPGGGMPTHNLLSEEGCTFLEATGEAGDFYLLHPYLLHAVSQNVLRRPRAICNVLFELKEPMLFNRPDGNYSPVESAILHGLGVDHYDFVATGKRYRTPDYGPLDPKWAS